MTAAVDRGAGARISRIDPRASRNPRIRSPAATRGLAKSCSFADPPPDGPVAPHRPDPRRPLRLGSPFAPLTKPIPTHSADDAGPNPRQDATDAGHPAPDPAEAKGWRLRLYWPALDRSFAGRVFDYDPRKKTHTVRWEQAAKNDGGMTEVDLSEGEVTWLSPPEPGWDAAPSAIADGDKRARSHSPPMETLEEVEKRIGVGTIKWICFQVLKEAGPHGLLLSEIVEKTQKKGLKDWTSVRQPSNTVNACCSGDPTFVKVAPARVGLACLGAHESKEIADEEEKAAGEKVLYCSACDNGPFNTKGMRMHISRWCTFAAGKPTADPNIVPTAVADPERSTRDAAVRITAHLAPSGTANDPNHKGSLDMPNHKAALKTFVCSACGAGPFNEKGMAMHASRWCKAKDNLDDVDANYVAAFGGALAQQQPTMSPTSYLGGSVGLTGLAPVGMPGVSIGALSGGLPADLGGSLAQLSNGGAHSGHITGSGSGSGGKKRKAPVDLGPVDPTMFDKHLPAFPVGFAAVAGASGLEMRGRMLPPPPVFGRRVGKSARGNKDEAHGETTELRLEVEVWKQEGSFVAKAPLVVPANVTLGKLKQAIADNTKGALPPHRQALKYLGVPLSAPDDVQLVGLLGVTDNISLHLTILEDTMAPPKGAGMPGSPARKAFVKKNLAM